MRTPIQVYACPSRRPATADRNFDNNDAPPLPDAIGVATLGDYAANAGRRWNTGHAMTIGAVPEVMSSDAIDTSDCGADLHRLTNQRAAGD